MFSRSGADTLTLTNQIQRLFSSPRWLILPPLVIGAIALALFAGTRRELVRVPVAEEAVPVRVLRVERRKTTARAIGFGTAQPARVWAAIVEVPGTITKTHASLRSGNHVDEGELLVQIDDLDYHLRARQREAELASAEAGVEELLANQAADQESLEIEEKLLQVTQKDLRRLKQLVQTSAASLAEVDRAEGDLLRQSQSVQQLRKSLALIPSRIAAARANVTLAEARLEEARRDLARTRILAPYSGVLSGVQIEPKQVVSQGTRLFELHDTDLIEIKSQFSPSAVLPLLRGEQEGGGPTIAYTSLMDAISDGRLTASVTAHSGNAEVRWPGKPTRVTESLDPATRTLGIVIAVDNTIASAEPLFAGRPLTAPSSSSRGKNRVASGADIRLYPGVYCEVTLSASESFDSIVIPNTASDAGTVYVVNDQHRIESREVTVAYASGQQLVIADGIEVGDTVVIKPPMPVIEGMLVIPEIMSDTTVDPTTASKSESRP